MLTQELQTGPMTNTSSRISKRYLILPWVICFVGVLFYCYEYYLRITPSVMTNVLMRDFSVNALALGNLTAFYYYAYAPMQLPVGLMLDRIGPRRSLTLACIVCGVASYFFATTHLLSILSLARFFIGAGSAFAFVGVLKLATVWLPERYFAMFSGLASGIGTIGAFVGDNTLSHAVTTIGWRQTVLYSAIAGIVLAVIIYLVIRDRKPGVVERKSAEAASFPELIKELLLILKNPQMWILGIIGCLLYLPTSAFAELWSIPYLRSVYHFSDEHASLVNSIIFIGFTVGGPTMGLISDKLRNRRWPMILGAFGAALFVSIIIFVPNLPDSVLMILYFLVGFCYSAEIIVFAVGKELSSRDYAGTAIAVTNMFVMLGGVIFQPAIGEILDWRWTGVRHHGLRYFSTTDYHTALVVLPIGLVMAGLLTFFLKETGKLTTEIPSHMIPPPR